MSLLHYSGFIIERILKPNQNLEQIARDQIDKQLTTCDWNIWGIKQLNLHVGIRLTVKEYRTDAGLAI